MKLEPELDRNPNVESMKLDGLGNKIPMTSTGICESDQFLVRISWKMYGFLTVSGRISVSKPQKFSPAALPGQVLLIRPGFQKIVLSRPGSQDTPHPTPKSNIREILAE